MNYGPLVFLAAFFALATSWVGFVLGPQLQVGQFQPTNTVPTRADYPVARPGLARQGLDVYRANGCAYCHSQQVGQTGTVCDVSLGEAGTNQAALTAVILKLRPDWSETQAKEALGSLPKAVLQSVSLAQAQAAVKELAVGGAKASVWVVPVGPDIGRAWGKRRSVAEDFLYDYPVMPGSLRVGPDLANVGARLPDANWAFRHLYAAQIDAKGSVMPRYPYLFEQRKIDHSPSPEALTSLQQFAPPSGYEVVPTEEARALVAYLFSLRADAPLYVAPLTVASAPATDTNAAAGTTPTNAPAK
jgi:cbb3-type cytochrome oxidase cytochrome c subunit